MKPTPTQIAVTLFIALMLLLHAQFERPSYLSGIIAVCAGAYLIRRSNDAE